MDSGSPLLRFSTTTSNFCTSVPDNSGLKQQYLTLTASGVRNRGAFHKNRKRSAPKLAQHIVDNKV